MRVEKLFQLYCTFCEWLCERELDFVDLVELFFFDLFGCFLNDWSFGFGCGCSRSYTCCVRLFDLWWSNNFGFCLRRLGRRWIRLWFRRRFRLRSFCGSWFALWSFRWCFRRCWLCAWLGRRSRLRCRFRNITHNARTSLLYIVGADESWL